MNRLIEKLTITHSLTEGELFALLEEASEEDWAVLTQNALLQRQKSYGNQVFIRGLVEFI